MKLQFRKRLCVCLFVVVIIVWFTLFLRIWLSRQQGEVSLGNDKEDLDSPKTTSSKPRTSKVDHAIDPSSASQLFQLWRNTRLVTCDEKIEFYVNQFAYFQGIVIDRNHCTCDRKGKERISDVINQPEETEYYRYSTGCFQVSCPVMPAYVFLKDVNHLNLWMKSLANVPTSSPVQPAIKTPRNDVISVGNNELKGRSDGGVTDSNRPIAIEENFTIAVTRYEYANLYHTMTDWYNAFLLMVYFNRTTSDTNILFVDAHPVGSLDPVWNRLFASSALLSSLPMRTTFKNLVWNILGYNSFITPYIAKNPPLLEEFRKFFLASHGFDVAGDRLLDCQHPSVLFIWRRDYVAHPRNPTGKLTRKITNERELIDHVRLAHPDFRVDGIQLDSMTMEDQLRYIVNADVLVGMHGAGLTHSIFLSNRSALVELLPTYWSSGDHFRAIANWRGLVYRRWINTDFAAESSDLRTTRVPVRIIDDLIVNALTSMCGSQCQSCQPTKKSR